jgi:hypothetical protein
MAYTVKLFFWGGGIPVLLSVMSWLGQQVNLNLVVGPSEIMVAGIKSLQESRISILRRLQHKLTQRDPCKKMILVLKLL